MAKEKVVPAALCQEKTVKMIFTKHMYYNDPNVPIYEADKVVDVPVSKVDRWLKRGGQLVKDLPKVVEEKKVEEKK